MSINNSLSNLIPDANDPIAVRRRHRRAIWDSVAKYTIAFGGISVIFAVVLIAFYLFYVVLPMFMPASVDKVTSYALPGDRGAQTLMLTLEEQAEVAGRINDDGTVTFFDVENGSVVESFEFDLPAGAEITSLAKGRIGSDWFALGLSDGSAMIAKHAYDISYPNDVRQITPVMEFPGGSEAIELDEDGEALVKLALTNDEEGSFSLAALTEDNRVVHAMITVEESFMGDVDVETEISTVPALPADVTHLAISGDHQWLYLFDSVGNVNMLDTRADNGIEIIDTKAAAAGGDKVTAVNMLLGGISVMVGTEQGGVSQWFPVRDDQNNYTIEQIRGFDLHDKAIVAIDPDAQRKGFLVLAEDDSISMNHTTAHRSILSVEIDKALMIAQGPRSDRMIALGADGNLTLWDVHNEHPDISFSALWASVWYESYQEPEYIWQSSAANQDFEPKFSLTPLTFGTLKAAFYAMLFAMPLAIMGAIFTAYFMNPKMRQLVKPTIEIMEALPTVILGFLAGLWLAPFFENNLPGVFALLVFMPLGILLFGFAWASLPKQIRTRVPDGWQAALVIPAVIFVGWFSFAMSGPFEQWFFAGDFRGWLTDDLGIDYDQRNSIVVGFAMGFAVIPTIFSITEDAIFGVPRHLSYGSLALGATPWQTLVRVVMPSASPGIFSAVMIGLGRAVGETMIVLMATGNTPVMNANIFEGMRTLSANIAVEMPESEVGSTHYGILFLAALVLFIFTFVVNTIAEVVRQRLRKKYATL